MSRSRHTEAQMIGALKQVEVQRAVKDVALEPGVSKHTLYARKTVWTLITVTLCASRSN